MTDVHAHETFRTARLADDSTPAPDCDECRRWEASLASVDRAGPALAPAPAGDARTGRIVTSVIGGSSQRTRPGPRLGRRRAAWAAVAAASLVVVGALAVVGGGNDEPALQLVASSTERASTASVRIDGEARLAITTLTIEGTGAVDFPDRVRLDLELDVDNETLDRVLPDPVSFVSVDDRSWLRLGSGAWRETARRGGDVLGGRLDAVVFDPASLLGSLRAAGAVDGPERASLDGEPVDVYRLTATGADIAPHLAGIDVPGLASLRDSITIDVEVSADPATSVLRRWEIVVAEPDATPVLRLTVDFDDHGEPVDIEPPA